MESCDQNKQHDPDPAVLDRLWTACSRVHSLACASSVAEPVVEAVPVVPGVEWRDVGGPVGDLEEHVCTTCTAEPQARYECNLAGAPGSGTRVNARETAAQRYGFIVIGMGEGGDLGRHKELLIDFRRSIAICLENRWQELRTAELGGTNSCVATRWRA